MYCIYKILFLIKNISLSISINTFIFCLFKDYDHDHDDIANCFLQTNFSSYLWQHHFTPLFLFLGIKYCYSHDQLIYDVKSIFFVSFLFNIYTPRPFSSEIYRYHSKRKHGIKVVSKYERQMYYNLIFIFRKINKLRHRWFVYVVEVNKKSIPL